MQNIFGANKGLISVIIPVYNSGRFLNAAIESVIKQSYANIELVLVNDGSTDNSGAICEKYAMADKRIQIISQKNSGPAGARNAGVRNAVGEFIFFLDADDLIEKDAFEILMAEYGKSFPDLVICNFKKIENDGRIVKQNAIFCPGCAPLEDKIRELDREDIANYVRHFLNYPSNHLISYCWARLYKADIIKKYDIIANESMRLFEDYIFNLEYLSHINKAIFVNRDLYTYTMHNAHVSASMAILNAGSLLHDMEIFQKNTLEFFNQSEIGLQCAINIKKEIGHALIHYAIIFMVRTCRLENKENTEKIHFEINKLINDSLFQESLKSYAPRGKNSVILPFLAKMKLVDLIVLYCKYKAYERYGKPAVK